MAKIAVVSGGFDPVHSGHIRLLQEAAKQGDKLFVALNSDEWLTRKKGRPFMPVEERRAVLQAMECVDVVIEFNDSDNTACDALRHIRELYPRDHVIFCNGGDRDARNIPEMDVPGVEFRFGIGGNDKANSSSWILKNWKGTGEHRVWGEFSNLFEDDNVKVKELIIEPGKGISYQRHFKRSEIWFVSKGSCTVKHSKSDPEDYELIEMSPNDVITINVNEWHQIYNTNPEPCHIIEIQYGQETSEEDIERLENYQPVDMQPA